MSKYAITSGTIAAPVKTVLYGPEGIGKSTFASHFPSPVFIDTEGGTKRLNVARLPQPTSWAMLLDEVAEVRKGNVPCSTLVIDTADWAERLCTAIESEQPDRIVLLGDLLYHGPRNDLPRDYAPKRVIPLLNALADRIIAVRGNCDAEVDQMVLDFPVMADYATLFDEAGRELFLTHGHVFGAGMHNSVDHAPALPEGSALVYGHTHIKVNEVSEAHPGLWLFNPGSVSIPKDGTHSYGIYENGAFRHVILEED